MTRKLAILLLLLALLALTGLARAQGFHQVYTPDGTVVWAVGDGGTVYRSPNAGVTWTSNPLGSDNHRGVAARGLRVWIVDDAGTLWSSEDGGTTFFSRPLGGGAAFHAITFVDESVGWIAGTAGTILHTIDGGTTWTSQITNTVTDLFALRFRSRLEGWACGAAGTALRTTDGGASWVIINPLATIRDLYDVDFDGATVYVAGSHSFLAQSTNSGVTWTAIDLKNTSRSDVNGLALGPDGALWLCGGGGFLRKWTAGRSFFPQHSIMTGMSDVFFLDSNRGWACARRSRNVARTTDGGLTWSVPGGGGYTYTWTRRLASNSAQIRGNTLTIDPLNRNKLYVVQGLMVFASWDIGESWYPIATISGVGSKTNAFLVSPTDTNTWLAQVQPGDRVTRTTNGGATWTTPIAIPYTEYGLPLEQDVNHPEHVYFAPEDGKIWKSTDFGATWFELSNPGFRSPDDIAVVPETTGVIYVGDGVTGLDNGEVWKSSDGGLTWSLKRAVPGSEIPMIAISRHDPWLAFATSWGFGGVVRTTDMGETWPNVSLVGAAWGADIAKDDPTVMMFAVYSGGASYLSTDRGWTFLRSTVGGANYGVLCYDRGTHLVHQSDGVWKATIYQPGMPIANVQTITLLAPSPGEAWQYGDLEKIAWSCQHIPTVRIELRTHSTRPWELVTAFASGPLGEFPWAPPPTPTDEARMRVSDASDGDPMSETAGTFRIIVPGVAASPEALDFGSTPIGTSGRRAITIVNGGTATLVLSSVAVAGSGPFTPTRTSLSIPPGGSDSVIVLFEPIAEQVYRDTLVIACNAPTTPVRVPLEGNGSLPVAVFPGAGLPERFELRDNVPNPFGASGTVISYTLPRESDVHLVVYNVLGQVVARLVDARQGPGFYAVRFPSAAANARGLASMLPSGVYFCRLRAGAYEGTRRLVLVR